MRSLTLSVILIVVGLLVFISGCSNYNTLVDMDENVELAFADLQSDYQRRADLIPNLVNTVKGAADFEQETLTAVADARAKATSVNIDPSNLSPEKLQQFQQAQGQVSQALSRLLVSVERYPELKANQNFRELQAQLEGTENRIKVARNKYNETVTQYNKKVRRFPGSIYASLFGFDRRDPFQAEEGAQAAPEVNF